MAAAIADGSSLGRWIRRPDDTSPCRTASSSAVRLMSPTPLRKIDPKVTRMKAPPYSPGLPPEIEQDVERLVDGGEEARVGFVGPLEAHHRTRLLVERHAGHPVAQVLDLLDDLGADGAFRHRHAAILADVVHQIRVVDSESRRVA